MRPLGKLGIRLEDNIKMHYKEIELDDGYWINVARDRTNVWLW